MMSASKSVAPLVGACVGICKAKYKAAGYTVAQIAKQSLPCICKSSASNPKKSYPNRYIQFYEEKIVTSSNRMEMITGEQLVSEYYKYFSEVDPEYVKKSIRSLPYNLDLIFNMNKHTPLNKHYTGKLSDIMGTTNIRDLKWVGVKFI